MRTTLHAVRWQSPRDIGRTIYHGHVIDELDGAPQVTAEDAILAARASGGRQAFAK